MRNKIHASVVFAATTIAISVSSALAVPTIDGTRDVDYGTPLFVQTVGSQFGNVTAAGGSPLQANGGSEIDGAYATVANGNLYLMFTGNLESNFNKFDLFIDSRAGGQNQLRGDNPDVEFNNLNRMGFNSATEPGLKFDAGFEADHFLTITNGNFPVETYSSYAELRTAGGGNGNYIGTNGGANNPLLDARNGGDAGQPALGLQWGLNNSNILGVGSLGNPNDSDPATVATGIEIVIPLAYLGDPTSPVKFVAFINGGGHDFISNQVSATLPAGTANLADPRLVDFSSATLVGDQFQTVTGVSAARASYTAASGNWNTGSNWSTGTAPNGVSKNAYLGGTGAAASITVDAATSVNAVYFDGGRNYTVGGTSVLTFDGLSTAIESVAGTHVINAPVASAKQVFSADITAGSVKLAGPVTLRTNQIQKHGAGTLVLPVTTADNFRVTAGTLKLDQAIADAQVIRNLNIADGANIDLSKLGAFFDWSGTGGITDPNNSFAFVKGLVAAGKITTSAGGAYAVGVVDNLTLTTPLTSFMGKPVDDTTTLIRATLKGDADLSGTVDFTDLLTLAQNYDETATGKEWVTADFDANGATGFTDLLVIAQNFNLSALSAGQFNQLADAGGIELAMAFSALVPEPTSLAAVAGLSLVSLRRRRK